MTMKATKNTTKTEIKVTTDIVPGPASLAQKTAWRKFWQKLIAEVKASER